MTPDEKLQYEKIKNNPSDYLFSRLFYLNKEGKAEPLPGIRFSLLNNTPFIEDAPQLQRQFSPQLAAYNSSAFSETAYSGNRNYGETIRGMPYVSPLVENYFSARTSEEISRLYFTDARLLQYGAITQMVDPDCKPEPVAREEFSYTNNHFDERFRGKLAFTVTLYISKSGNKIKEIYECAQPEEGEVLLFLEDNEGDIFSGQVLLGKVGSGVLKNLYSSSHLYNNNNVFTYVNKHFNIDKETLQQLLEKGSVETSFSSSLLNGLLSFVSFSSLPLTFIGEKLGLLADQIQLLSLSDKIWDTENPNYIFDKNNLIQNLSVDTGLINTIKSSLTEAAGFSSITKPILQPIVDCIHKILNKINTGIQQYNQTIAKIISKIYDNLHYSANNLSTAEWIALYCGIWNGVGDFLASTLRMIADILQSPHEIASHFHEILETLDTVLDNFMHINWEEVGEAFADMHENLKKYLSGLTKEDFNWVRISYSVGFGIAFITTFFIPFTQLTKITRLEKIKHLLPTDFFEKLSGTYKKTSTFIGDKSASSLKVTLRLIEEMSEIFNKEALTKFFDKIWGNFSEWFLKNRKLYENKLQKIKKYLSKSKKIRFRTIKMLKNYVGEETGKGWCAPKAVKYLTESERIKYKLAILEGKLYTSNGKLFDTSLAGCGKIPNAKAIFVMDKNGRIFAENKYPRFYFHHSSFLAGGEVAAAGEITVVKGIIHLVSKQSGHYQPSTRYMKQFMKVLEESGIDVNKIIVDF